MWDYFPHVLRVRIHVVWEGGGRAYGALWRNLLRFFHRGSIAQKNRPPFYDLVTRSGLYQLPWSVFAWSCCSQNRSRLIYLQQSAWHFANTLSLQVWHKWGPHFALSGMLLKFSPTPLRKPPCIIFHILCGQSRWSWNGELAGKLGLTILAWGRKLVPLDFWLWGKIGSTHYCAPKVPCCSLRIISWSWNAWRRSQAANWPLF